MHEHTLELPDVRSAEVVMMKGSLDLDVILPKRPGMRAVLLDRRGARRKSPYPDAIVENLTEAMEVIYSWMWAER